MYIFNDLPTYNFIIDLDDSFKDNSLLLTLMRRFIYIFFNIRPIHMYFMWVNMPSKSPGDQKF
jgi:hypothetical protein